MYITGDDNIQKYLIFSIEFPHTLISFTFYLFHFHLTVPKCPNRGKSKQLSAQYIQQLYCILWTHAFLLMSDDILRAVFLPVYATTQAKENVEMIRSFSVLLVPSLSFMNFRYLIIWYFLYHWSYSAMSPYFSHLPYSHFFFFSPYYPSPCHFFIWPLGPSLLPSLAKPPSFIPFALCLLHFTMCCLHM